MTVNIDDKLAARIQAITSVRQEPPADYVLRAIEDMVRQDEDDRPDTYDPNKWKGSSITQSFEKMRAKHGLPDDWGTSPISLTDQDWADIDAAHAQIYSGAPRAK